MGFSGIRLVVKAVGVNEAEGSPETGASDWFYS